MSNNKDALFHLAQRSRSQVLFQASLENKTVSDIARTLHRTHATVKEHVERLQENGIVTIKPSPSRVNNERHLHVCWQAIVDACLADWQQRIKNYNRQARKEVGLGTALVTDFSTTYRNRLRDNKILHASLKRAFMLRAELQDEVSATDVFTDLASAMLTLWNTEIPLPPDWIAKYGISKRGTSLPTLAARTESKASAEISDLCARLYIVLHAGYPATRAALARAVAEDVVGLERRKK